MRLPAAMPGSGAERQATCLSSFSLLLLLVLPPSTVAAGYVVAPRATIAGPLAADPGGRWRRSTRPARSRAIGSSWKGRVLPAAELGADDGYPPEHRRHSYGVGRRSSTREPVRSLSRIDTSSSASEARRAGRKTGTPATASTWRTPPAPRRSRRGHRVPAFRRGDQRDSDARITNVHAHQNGYAGINSGGDLSKNLYIGYCLTENNPGDPSSFGITAAAASSSAVDVALVEYCESTYNGGINPGPATAGGDLDAQCDG